MVILDWEARGAGQRQRLSGRTKVSKGYRAQGVQGPGQQALLAHMHRSTAPWSYVAGPLRLDTWLPECLMGLACCKQQ